MKPPTRIVVPAMSLARAILIGQLVVNLPVLLIILGAAGIGMALAYRLAAMLAWFPDWGFILGGLLSIMAGALLAWPWWCFAVPRWRRWALRQGVPADQLQKWGGITGLVWPKGSPFEKTEFHVRD